MNTNAQTRQCLITGAHGYLGSRMTTAFQRAGWRVTGLCRKPEAAARESRFVLGEAVSGETLRGASLLVHCAYDFMPLSWPAIRATNVAGTEQLFRAAGEAGVERLVCISSISAFEGCRSLYGKAKLEIEGIARTSGALILRPGLIHGSPPAGMFGRLVRQVDRSRVLPLVGGGHQIQYLVHDSDICALATRFGDGEFAAPAGPVTLAHERPWPFREILEEIAHARGRCLRFVHVPWRLLWAAIKCAETTGVPVSFRSDSLLSLMYKNPAPAFALQRQMGITCRPFQF